MWRYRLRQESSTLRYDGPYIDLVQEERLETAKPTEDITIQKIDTSTGYGTVTGAGNSVFPQFNHDGQELQLRFDDHVLTGYRKTYAELIDTISGDKPFEDYSEESQRLIEQFAIHVLQDDAWTTRDLEVVLADYEKQVADFLEQHKSYS